jgi:hypothetical protein
MCETPQLYFAPYTMPRDTIALRLHQLFPSAKIIFTIRDQRHYAESMYLNLKRNAAYFDQMSVAPFSEWLAGTLSLWRAHYLQNLNFYECISLYARIFGHQNICVMPLEMAVRQGARAYLSRLCGFMGLELDTADVTDFETVHNRRMSVRQELAAELLADERFHRLYADLSEALGAELLAAVLDQGPRSSVAIRPADEEQIRHRVEIGNRLLAGEFQLDLAGYGYLLANGHEPIRNRLRSVEQEFSLERDADPLHGRPHDEVVPHVHRSAEILALRTQLAQLASELETVGRSPVWRTVKRIEGARRILSRAAAMVFSSTGRARVNAAATEPSRQMTRSPVAPPDGFVAHQSARART